MANLNSWQRIDRVIAGKPFGDGIDGDYNSSTIPTMTYRSCSGSASSTTLTLTSAGFSNGDLILIHQTRGTGAGQWEINYVVSGGGTTSLTLLKPLYYTYTDSGASQAQAVKIPRYNNVTCPSGTWTVPSWNGDTGGILVLAARGTVTIAGTKNGKGVGFVKGSQENAPSYNGEGTGGPSSRAGDVANGNGGGGSNDRTPNGGGSGGGNGTAGVAGGGNFNAGASAGSADLTMMVFGGGGGGGETVNNGYGGNGGGICVMFAKNIMVTGGMNFSGNNGNNATSDGGGGGGGAGGSILIVCQSATLGSSLITATGGSGGNGSGGAYNGGAGGVGRIALHYSGTYSGSTNPTLYANQDTTLVESVGGIFFHNFL